MNQARMNSMVTGLSAIARKVYDAVPASETWDYVQINAEFKRKTGASLDYKTFQGCVSSLVASGLVREPSKGEFIRVATHVKPQISPIKEVPSMAQPKTPQLQVVEAVPVEPASTTKASLALDRIGVLSKELRLQSTMLAKLADELDEAVLDFEAERVSDIDALQRLKLLKQVLKDL